MESNLIYKNLKEVIEILECKICFNILNKASLLPCNHTFCRICIYKYTFDKDIIKCPICKNFYKIKDIKCDKVLEKISDLFFIYNDIRFEENIKQNVDEII